MSKLCRFLIVVPTLNSYKLLPRLVTSLQQQTFHDWRLLFVDGPSCSEHREWLVNCCQSDPRLSWILQDPDEIGIFGAMNQGFSMVSESEYLMFWGSDDWAASSSVFEDLVIEINRSFSLNYSPDLLVCAGKYVNLKTGVDSRSTVFHSAAFLNSSEYRLSLFWGSSPPHQSTIFCPGARQLLSRYSHRFSLSADLAYFLQLSACKRLVVQCSDLVLVRMYEGGVSTKHTRKRLQEVRQAYRSVFGWKWIIPFLMRYSRRLLSLFYVR